MSDSNRLDGITSYISPLYTIARANEPRPACLPGFQRTPSVEYPERARKRTQREEKRHHVPTQPQLSASKNTPRRRLLMKVWFSLSSSNASLVNWKVFPRLLISSTKIDVAQSSNRSICRESTGKHPPIVMMVVKGEPISSFIPVFEFSQLFSLFGE